MAVSCEQHRPYLAAVADNELEVVPASTLAHVRACPTCRREVETHSLLSARLQEAAAAGSSLTGAGRRRLWAAAAMATLLIAALIAGLAGWRGPGGQDQVLAAASAAQGPPQFHSSDEAAIGAWCERQSGRSMPLVALPSLVPQGARTDQVDGVQVVTLAYKTDSGSRVTVSWLNDTPSQSNISDRSVAGRTVLLVRSRSGTTVVAGDASQATLRSIAAQLQAGRGGALQPAVS